MKKVVILLVLIIMAIFASTVSLQVSAATSWQYEEVKVEGEKEYLVQYNPTGKTAVSFRAYSEVIQKPINYVKTAQTTVTKFNQHVISGSLEFEAKAGVIFSSIGTKLTVGYAYTFGSSYSTTYSWQYAPNDVGDYAIYGVKTTSTEYTYQVLEHKTESVCVEKNSFGNCTKTEIRDTDEWKTTPVETGIFWQHSKYGQVGLYAWKSVNYMYVMEYFSRGEFCTGALFEVL
jgi:hypothetical protein